MKKDEAYSRKLDYIKKWQKFNANKVRFYKSQWYYRNKAIVNGLFSKGKYVEVNQT